MKTINFEIALTPKTKKVRKSFTMQHIPSELIKKYGIKDGTSCFAEMSVGDWKEIKTCRISSGGEMGVGKKISDALLALAKIHPEKTIKFIVHLVGANVQEKFEDRVQKSMKDSKNERKKRLKKAAEEAKNGPKKYIASTIRYSRNPDVVAEVLSQAKGKCGKCKKMAPFKRKTNGTPYLEVHHNKKLADGGLDTVENAIALCPNCHRREHHG